MIKRCGLAAMVWLAQASIPAAAGDTAALDILGFSADGSVFAFEEYGIQDGSGFPYANRFYIDTEEDAFLPGSPIRVRLDDEDTSLDDARGQAREAGEAIIPEDELREHAGVTAGANPVTELSADPHRMAVNPRPVVPPVDRALEIRLEEIGFPVPQSCDGFGRPHVGFRLLRIGTEAGEPTRLLHEDESVPTSRRCPIGYRIGAIQTFIPEEGPARFVVLIAVESIGFEGPDYRWIAIPGKL